MPVLKWEVPALEDLADIVDYIERFNFDAARNLKEEIETKARMLPLRPRLYRPGRLPGTREMVVRSNYIVVYTETSEVVTILRVIHSAGKWPA